MIHDITLHGHYAAYGFVVTLRDNIFHAIYITEATHTLLHLRHVFATIRRRYAIDTITLSFCQASSPTLYAA